MEHEGNTHTSTEEAAAVARLLDELLGDGDGDGDSSSEDGGDGDGNGNAGRVMLREGTRPRP